MATRGGKGRHSITRKLAEAAGFRSGAEHKVAAALESFPFEYETETFSYVVPEKRRKYTPDFVLIKKRNKGKMYLEVKGILDFETREKMVLVKQHNPELDLRFVFQNPYNRIAKRSKTRYCDWAEANGFLWSGLMLPEEWLNELKKTS